MANEIIKVLDNLGEKFGIAIDWSSANVVPYLQDLMTRIVKYETYTSIAWIVLFILGILILLAIRKLIKDEEIKEYISMGLAIWIVLSALVFSKQVLDIIEVNTIPEKYVIHMINNELDNE